MKTCSNITDVSSRSHPEEVSGFASSYSVEVWWVYWLNLDRDFIGQEFVKTLLSILCQVSFAGRKPRGRETGNSHVSM